MSLEKSGGNMFNLWYNLVFNAGDSKNEYKKVLKFLATYILPTIIMIIFPNIIGIDINYNIKYTLVILIIINLLYSSVIHVYIQKMVFLNLKKDVIIKFIPDRINDYITLRVLMIFIKSYLPIVTASILIFKDVVSNSNIIFYIGSLLIIVSIIFANVLIAIFYKYFSNTVKERYLKIGNFFVFIYISSLVLFVSTVPIWYLENIFHSVNSDGIITSEIKIKGIEILLIILVIILVLVLSKFTKDFLKLKGRVLILERVLTINENKNTIRNTIESFIEKVYSIKLSNIERSVFAKDIKLAIRESKYSLLFIILLQVINIGFILFFYFAEKIQTSEVSIMSCKIFTGMLIMQILAACFITRTTLEKNINIENDFQVLKNYNIRFRKKSLIKVKTRFLSAIVSPKIILVFSILILGSLIVNVSSYLALIYLLAMIQLIFINKTMELWQVKAINKWNSNNEILKIINSLSLLGGIYAFIYVFRITESDAYVKGQLVLIVITAVIYMYNLLVNNKKDN